MFDDGTRSRRDGHVLVRQQGRKVLLENSRLVVLKSPGVLGLADWAGRLETKFTAGEVDGVQLGLEIRYLGHELTLSTQRHITLLAHHPPSSLIIMIIIIIIIFCPFAIETAGAWHETAIEVTQEIDRRITVVTEDSKETEFLFQRLSMALQRGMRSPSRTL